MHEKPQLRDLTREEEHHPRRNHQSRLPSAATGQDEVPGQGKILTTVMLLVVFSAVVAAAARACVCTHTSVRPWDFAQLKHKI